MREEKEVGLKGCIVVVLMLGGVIVGASLLQAPTVAVSMPTVPALTQLYSDSTTPVNTVPFDQVCGAGFNYCTGGGGGSVRALAT